ncbi:PREDICTED: hornerin-like [Nicrophorus vespilloides]|uniref:Hornerin-like n=1 Tax=Nicrophorus vespilloides TaxID=110193 RepID=A0ABM1MAW1_NICVS|nr:PREDICTED: hornerin-like [Nicrophorus vespilloides]
MARNLILISVTLLLLNSFGSTKETTYKDLEERKIQNATITHVTNALGVSRIYDYVTKTIAYKDYLLKKCFVERMNGQPFWIASRNLIEINEHLTADTVEKIGGPRVSDFCFGWVTHLIQDPNYGMQENEIDTGRIKRDANYYRGRVRGQTQSQYLNFGNGESDGKAEAESTAEGSKAFVTGKQGMGQAQSQSSPFSCADCYGQDNFVTGGRQQQSIAPGPLLPGKQLGQVTGQYPGQLTQGVYTSDTPRHGGNLVYKPTGPGSSGSQYTTGSGGISGQYPGGQYPSGPKPGSQPDTGKYGGGTQTYIPSQIPMNQQQPGTGSAQQIPIAQYPGGSQPSGQYGGGSQQQGLAQYPGGMQQQGPGQYPGRTQQGSTQYPGGAQQQGSTKYPGRQQGSPQYPGGTQQQGTGQYPGGQQGSPQYPSGTQQQGTGQYPGGQQGAGQYPGGQGLIQYPGGQGPTQYSGGQQGSTEYPGALQQGIHGGTQQGSGQYPGRTQQQGSEQRPGVSGQYPGGISNVAQYPHQIPGRPSAHYPDKTGQYSGIQQPTGQYSGGVQQTGIPSVPRDGQYTAPIQQSVHGIPGGKQPIAGGQQTYTSQYPQGQSIYHTDGRTQESYPQQGHLGKHSGVFDGQLSGNYQSNRGNAGQFSGTFSGKYNSHGDGQSGSQFGAGAPAQISTQTYPTSPIYTQLPTTGTFVPGRATGQPIVPGGTSTQTYVPGTQDFNVPGQIRQPAGPAGGTQQYLPSNGQTFIPGSAQTIQHGGPGRQLYIPGTTAGSLPPGVSQLYGPGPQGGPYQPDQALSGYVPGSQAPSSYDPASTGGHYINEGIVPSTGQPVGQTVPSRGQVGPSGSYLPGGGQISQYAGQDGQVAPSGPYLQGGGQTHYADQGAPSGTYLPGGGQTTQYTSQGGQGAPSYFPGGGQTNQYAGQVIPTSGIQGGSSGSYIPAKQYTDQTQPTYSSGQQIPAGGIYPAGQHYPGQTGGAVGEQWDYGRSRGDSGQGVGYSGQNVPANLITDEQQQPDDANSQAETSIQQVSNGTQASANAQGHFEGGSAQSQVSGTYAGTGSFSASAGSNDGKRGAQTQVSGGKEGAVSSAQGNGGKGQSQAQVQLSSETGETMSSAQSGGINHGSNSQVQAGDKGGMADAQANGPGSTSSQAQIGFLPYDENKPDDQSTPFNGGGSASSQSGTYSGQSQVQIQGTHKFGIRYNGGAQASSANVGKTYGNTMPTLKPMYSFNTPAVNKNDAMTQQGFGQYPGSTQQQGSVQRPGVSGQNPVDEKTSASKVQRVMTALPSTTTTTTTTTSTIASNEDYDYDLNSEESSTTSNTQESTDTQRHDSLDPVEDLQSPTNGRLSLRDGTILGSGVDVGGFKIPPGFRGRVSNSHTVISPSKIIYQKPVYAVGARTNLKDGRVGYGSGYSIQPTTYPIYHGNPQPGFVSLTKSETGSKNVITGKKTPSVYYTQSSSCGYFTNSCFYENGKKICMPKPKLNPDGSPMIC